MAETKLAPLRTEIDSGVRIALLDDDTLLAVIYRPPVENPPTGFDNSNVYYYVVREVPSNASTLTLDVTLDDAPGFSASEAVSATAGALQEQGSAPASSSTLWVEKDSYSWAVDWQLSGTGTEVQGSVSWWRSISTPFTTSAGSHDASNGTSVSSSAIWKGTDSWA